MDNFLESAKDMVGTTSSTFLEEEKKNYITPRPREVNATNIDFNMIGSMSTPNLLSTHFVLDRICLNIHDTI